MRHSIRAVVGAALLIASSLAMSPRPVAADTPHASFVDFENKTNAYVWVTAYDGNYRWGTRPQLGAWCVAPHASDSHGLKAEVGEVRAEVSRTGCQHNPVLLNELRGFPFHNGYTQNRMTYYVHESNGKYIYDNTP